MFEMIKETCKTRKDYCKTRKDYYYCKTRKDYCKTRKDYCKTRKDYWSEEHVEARRRWKNNIKIRVEKCLNCILSAQNIAKRRNRLSTAVKLRIT